MEKKLKTTALVLMIGLLVLLMLPGTAQAGKFVRSIPVEIPFNLDEYTGYGVAWVDITPGPGYYRITLEVVRAPWDVVGVNGVVPIGMRSYVKSGKYKLEDSGWRTGLWKKMTYVRLTNNQTIRVEFSTSAPAGALGKLTIEEV